MGLLQNLTVPKYIRDVEVDFARLSLDLQNELRLQRFSIESLFVMNKIIRIFFSITLLPLVFATNIAHASQEIGLGLGFNPEGREEATGDSFVVYGYRTSVSDSFKLGAKAQFRNYGATLSENSHYQDRIISLLLNVRYYVSEKFFVGALLGPQWKLRSTIVWSPTYAKSRETFFDFGYIPKPELGVSLPLGGKDISAIEFALALSNKGQDVLSSISLSF